MAEMKAIRGTEEKAYSKIVSCNTLSVTAMVLSSKGRTSTMPTRA